MWNSSNIKAVVPPRESREFRFPLQGGAVAKIIVNPEPTRFHRFVSRLLGRQWPLVATFDVVDDDHQKEGVRVGVLTIENVSRFSKFVMPKHLDIHITVIGPGQGAQVSFVPHISNWVTIKAWK